MTGAHYEWPVFCFSPEATIKLLFFRFLVTIFSSLRITESSQSKKVPMFEQAFKNIDDALRKEAGCASEQKGTGPNTIEYKIGQIFGEIKNLGEEPQWWRRGRSPEPGRYHGRDCRAGCRECNGFGADSGAVMNKDSEGNNGNYGGFASITSAGAAKRDELKS